MLRPFRENSGDISSSVPNGPPSEHSMRPFVEALHNLLSDSSCPGDLLNKLIKFCEQQTHMSPQMACAFFPNFIIDMAVAEYLPFRHRILSTLHSAITCMAGDYSIPFTFFLIQLTVINPPLFRILFDDLLTLLGDVAELVQAHPSLVSQFSGQAGPLVIEIKSFSGIIKACPELCQSFPLGPTYENGYLRIDIELEEGREGKDAQFVLGLMEVVKGLTASVPQLLDDQDRPLWECLLHQIQLTQNPHIKRASISTIHSMIVRLNVIDRWIVESLSILIDQLLLLSWDTIDSDEESSALCDEIGSTINDMVYKHSGSAAITPDSIQMDKLLDKYQSPSTSVKILSQLYTLLGVAIETKPLQDSYMYYLSKQIASVPLQSVILRNYYLIIQKEREGEEGEERAKKKRRLSQDSNVQGDPSILFSQIETALNEHLAMWTGSPDHWMFISNCVASLDTALRVHLLGHRNYDHLLRNVKNIIQRVVDLVNQGSVEKDVLSTMSILVGIVQVCLKTTMTSFFNLICLAWKVGNERFRMDDLGAIQFCKGCIKAMPLFPVEYSKQLEDVYVQCLREVRPSVLSVAIHQLPLFLHHHKNLMPTFITLLRDLMKGENTDILVSIGDVIGKLSCIAAGSSRITSREMDGIPFILKSRDLPDSSQSYIQCSGACDAGEKAMDVSTPTILSPVDWDVFTQTCFHSSDEISSAFLSSFPRILYHMNVSAEEKWKRLDKMMELCVNPSPSIRETFSLVLQTAMKGNGFYLFGPQNDSAHSPLGNLMFRLVSMKKEERKEETSESIIRTFGRLGSVLSGDDLLLILVTLMKEMDKSPLLVSEQINVITTHKELSKPRNLLLDHDSDSFHGKLPYKIIVENCNDSLIEQWLESKQALEEWYSKSSCDILTYIMTGPRDERNTALERLEKKTGSKSRGNLILDCLPELLCNILVDHPSHTESSLNLLCEILRVPPRTILEAHLSQVLYRLSEMLGDHPMEPVLHALNRVISIMELKTDISDFLEQNFLSIMDHINGKLFPREERSSSGDIHRSSSEETKLLRKKSLVTSIEKLIDILGKHICGHRPKVASTLELLIKLHPDVHRETVQAWLTFVKELDVPHLGGIMGQVFVVLSPLGKEGAPDDVKEIVKQIFEYIVIEKKQQMSPYFKEIPFALHVDEYPTMKEVCKVLENKPIGLLDQLDQLARAIEHENANIRSYTLTRLRGLLEERGNELRDGLLHSRDPQYRKVIEALVKGLILAGNSETLRENKLEIAACLGEIGAVESCHFSDISRHLRPDKPVEKSDHDFGVDLIENYLIKVMRGGSRDTNVQDRASYAIQEVLKIFKCQEKADKKKKSEPNMWDCFSVDIQAIIRPLLNSTYELKEEANVTDKEKTTVISSVSSYRMWIIKWTRQLIKVSRGSKSGIFWACRGVIRDDLSTTLYLLPYVLIDVLNHNLEYVPSISHEMLGVLEKEESSEFVVMCSQRVFYLIDWLNEWLETIRKKESERKKGNRRITTEPKSSVEQLLSNIPQMTMSRAAYRCKDYARSLLHLESFIKSKHNDSGCLMANVEALEEIFHRLGDHMNLAALSSIRGETTLEQTLFDLKSSGNWSEAQNIHDQCIQANPNDIRHVVGLLECLQHGGQTQTMKMIAQQALNTRKDEEDINGKTLRSYASHAAWRLSDWTDLNTFLSHPVDDGFEVQVGRCLLATREGERDKLTLSLKRGRQDIMASLSVSTLQSYEASYSLLGKLQILTEIERFSLMLMDNHTTPTNYQKQVERLWDTRMDVVENTLKSREPLLTVRRVLLEILKEKTKISHPMIPVISQNIAKLARKADQLQMASSCLTRSKLDGGQGVLIEETKILWKKGEQHRALQMLQTYRDNKKKEKEDQALEGRILLSIARWSQSMELCDPPQLVDMYDTVVKRRSNWEKGYFQWGRYCDSLWIQYQREHGETHIFTAKSSIDPALPLDWFFHAIDGYSKSLSIGSEYIHHSLPRLLTNYFDFGTNVLLLNSQKETKEMKVITERYNKVSEIVKNADICAYQWYTVLPQMISRICHNNKAAFSFIRQVLSKVLKTYPKQTSWLMASVNQSKEQNRSKRAQDVDTLARKESKTEELANYLEKFKTFVAFLTDMCHITIEPEKVKEFDISRQKGRLTNYFRYLKDLASYQIILPLQAAMTIELPHNKEGGKPGETYNGFHRNPTTVRELEDHVIIMSSIARPKKMTWLTNEGKRCHFLCKPKDDLRHDARTMEINTMINILFRKDGNCRKHQLYIRTYSVVPLDELNGIIEWMDNTHTIRNVVSPLFEQQMGSSAYVALTKKTAGELKNKMPPDIRIQKFKEIQQWWSSPVMHKWYLEKFSDPSSWLQARNSFTKSCAVMSMIGYILGLGDRHSENIMLDANNGDCVHVDFNCLFYKGLTFAEPETVPFRLTNNMLDVMGILGYKGIFVNICRQSLSLIRQHRETLLSVLETFIYDPLQELKEKKNKGYSEPISAQEEATRIILELDKRLQGKGSAGFQQSVDAQVHLQIGHATSVENLAMMYVGWNAWI
ncbi:serine/threonine-protein kinase ATR-like [Planoprotostelium fungivorum]|uniref:Serine/threonine-protein kinase ATR n=1 Tax=Planoprotostelium fungivorum TaxID=1890364 RepID=A0A2P6NPY2_9EUKA|nr:serine/threonine-protein kinase ATR-like [Planoprotostelium fungivorum]